MLTFIASFLIIAAALLAMAVGVLFGRRPVTGSCGGLNRTGLGIACMFCVKRCRREGRGKQTHSEQ